MEIKGTRHCLRNSPVGLILFEAEFLDLNLSSLCVQPCTVRIHPPMCAVLP